MAACQQDRSHRGSTMQSTQTWAGFVRLLEELDAHHRGTPEPLPATPEEVERVPGMEYCPTPEQIHAECAKIQSEWSERERWRRAGYPAGRAPRWTPPQTATPQFDNQDLAWAV